MKTLPAIPSKKLSRNISFKCDAVGDSDGEKVDSEAPFNNSKIFTVGFNSFFVRNRISQYGGVCMHRIRKINFRDSKDCQSKLDFEVHSKGRQSP